MTEQDIAKEKQQAEDAITRETQEAITKAMNTCDGNTSWVVISKLGGKPFVFGYQAPRYES